MRMSDINKKFTEYVSKYLNEGYIFSNTMAGHQGEINKVDLVKDKELIRIFLNNERAGNLMDDNALWGDKIVLRVSKWIKAYHPRFSGTVWNSDCEVIEEVSYYEVGRGHHWYVDSIEEAKRCQAIHLIRIKPYYYGSRKEDITSEDTKDIAVKYLRRKLGYQRVSRDCIKVSRVTHSRNEVSYEIEYKGHYCRLR